MKRFLAVWLVISLLVMTGCATMSPVEKVEYNQVKVRIDQNALQEIEKKDPGVAGGLNVLPGIGNAYLGQWGLFIGNLLLWPYSIVWGVPQAVADAKTINKQETLAYYKFGAGKDILEAREAKNTTKPAAEPIEQQEVESVEQPEIGPVANQNVVH